MAARGSAQWSALFVGAHSVRPPSIRCPRCMFGNSGADHLVEAPVSIIEENGSDSLCTPFLRAPRRPGMPAKQRNSLGSGPAGPENFGYFPSLESSPPAGGISPKKRNRGFALRGEFLSERSERNQRIAGGCGFWERPAAYALVFQEPLPYPSVAARHLPLTGGVGPRTPAFTEV